MGAEAGGVWQADKRRERSRRPGRNRASRLAGELKGKLFFMGIFLHIEKSFLF